MKKSSIHIIIKTSLLLLVLICVTTGLTSYNKIETLNEFNQTPYLGNVQGIFNNKIKGIYTTDEKHNHWRCYNETIEFKMNGTFINRYSKTGSDSPMSYDKIRYGKYSISNDTIYIICNREESAPNIKNREQVWNSKSIEPLELVYTLSKNKDTITTVRKGQTVYAGQKFIVTNTKKIKTKNILGYYELDSLSRPKNFINDSILGRIYFPVFSPESLILSRKDKFLYQVPYQGDNSIRLKNADGSFAKLYSIGSWKRDSDTLFLTFGFEYEYGIIQETYVFRSDSLIPLDKNNHKIYIKRK